MTAKIWEGVKRGPFCSTGTTNAIVIVGYEEKNNKGGILFAFDAPSFPPLSLQVLQHMEQALQAVIEKSQQISHLPLHPRTPPLKYGIF